MKAEKPLPPFWVSEYESPVPGMLTVVRLPRRLKLTVAPRPPTLTLVPREPKLSRTPFAMRTLLRNLKPTCFSPVLLQRRYLHDLYV